MSQRTTGWRSIFSLPLIYRLAQRSIGSENVRSTVAESYLKHRSGDRILDIGCGTGDLVEHLVGADYVGFDPSSEYIDAARARFGDRARFAVAGVTEMEFEDGTFDLCVAKGVLHHLDDDLATSLFRDAARALRPGGRLVTIDPVFASGQSRVARFLAGRDRGENVRTLEQYQALATDSFDDIEAITRHDLLRVPYSHAVLVATR